MNPSLIGFDVFMTTVGIFRCVTSKGEAVQATMEARYSLPALVALSRELSTNDTSSRVATIRTFQRKVRQSVMQNFGN